MQPFDLLKEDVKRRNSINSTIEETDHSIRYESNNGYRFEYEHRPDQLDFLQSIHSYPLMVLCHTLSYNGAKHDEKWMFYVQEPDVIIQLHVNVWKKGEFSFPKLSCWESNEKFENQGLYNGFEKFRHLAKPILDHVMNMPAYRLFYITQDVEKRDLKKFI